MTKGNGKQGFASMPSERQKEIASLGGKASWAKGKAHRFTPEKAKIAGKKGGSTQKKQKGAV